MLIVLTTEIQDEYMTVKMSIQVQETGTNKNSRNVTNTFVVEHNHQVAYN